MANGFFKRMEAFGQTIATKVQTTTDIVSIQNDIAAKQRQLTDVHTEIGEAYAQAHAADEAPEFPELLARVAHLSGAIAELDASVQRMKGYRQCERCKAYVEADAAFCPRCGAEMPKEPEPEVVPVQPEEDAEARCDACGEALAQDADFCTVCGKKRGE